MNESEDYEWLTDYAGKKVLIVLKNGFKYTTSNLQLVGEFIRFNDRMNMRVAIHCSDIQRVEELE